MNESKCIVITGATGGLGRALVRKFSSLGHRVTGCGTRSAGVAELQRNPGPADHFSIVNICKPKQVKHWAEDLILRFGPPDLLINNAGTINENAPFWDVPEEAFARVQEVNILGTAHVIRAFLPSMLKRKSGLIINISSGCGRKGFAELSPYCTSKFAIEGLSHSLAQELPPGMACIPLSPGVIDTDMLRSCWGEQASQCDSPADWAEYAAPYILGLTPDHNGQSLRIPQNEPG